MLEGKTALVTGGGTGIGAAIAKRFVEEGAKVCITGRRKEKLEEQARLLDVSVLAIPGDVSNFDDVKRMVAAAVEFGGKLDILVNNAATDVWGPVTDLDIDDFRSVLETNLVGPFMLMKEAIPHMIAAGGGSIISVASIGGVRCIPGAPAYGASKAGLIFLTQQVAVDYGRFGIRCNVVCPGATRTAMLEAKVSGKAEGSGADLDGILQKFSNCLPLKRVSQPEEIAGVCCFLAGPDSSFMTGAVLLADGGSTIMDTSSASMA